MKWILKQSIISLLLVLLVVPSVVFATEEFPYDGTYVTDEDYGIKGFVFDQEQETITILVNQNATRLSNRVTEIMNFNYEGYYEIVLDTQEHEVSTTPPQQNDANVFEEILLEVADDIEPWMTRTDVFKLVDQQIPGLHFYPDMYNFNEAMIVKPTIETSQNLWVVSTNTRRILRFEISDDLKEITDDYQITYTKVEVGEEND